MSQSPTRSSGAFFLTCVTQALLFVVAAILLANLLNIGNLLYLPGRFVSKSTAAWLHAFAYADLTLSAAALIFAGIRLHAPRLNGATLAQIVAILNTFLTIFLWGFNAFAVAAGGMFDVSLQPTALILGIAFALATLLAASMLAGVIRHHKNMAPPTD